MQEALYLTDSYLKEFESVVKSVKDGKYITLEKSAFYPNSGGQPYDTGILIRKSDNKEFHVIFVGKFNGEISHEVEPEGLDEGDEIIGKINWERRYMLMKAHTSAHIVSEMIHKETSAMITGNQLGTEKIRIDFSTENFDQELLKKCIEDSNKEIEKDLKIKTYFLQRAEAEKIPNLTKLAKGLPEELQEIRILEIEDFDIQADGGTHVNSTKEVGKLEFIKAENKGKNFRRLYYKII